MRQYPTSVSLFLVLLGIAAPAHAGPSGDPSVLGGKLDATVVGVITPAFQAAQGLSDTVFDFMRVHVLSPALPPGFSENMRGAASDDSSDAFARKLQGGELRYVQRLQDIYPRQASSGPLRSPALEKAWRSWAAREQLSVMTNALTDTFLERHQLGALGAIAQAYGEDIENWDAHLLTTAAIAGSAALYLDGLHASTRLGAVRFGFDLAPGGKFRGGSANHAAAVQLRYKDSPLAIVSSWDFDHGSVGKERLSVQYNVRY